MIEAENDVEMTCQCCEVGSFIVSGRLDCDHCTISAIYITWLGLPQLCLSFQAWLHPEVSVDYNYTGQRELMAGWQADCAGITRCVTTAGWDQRETAPGQNITSGPTVITDLPVSTYQLPAAPQWGPLVIWIPPPPSLSLYTGLSL